MRNTFVLFTLIFLVVFSFKTFSSDYFAIKTGMVKGKYKSLVVKCYCDTDVKDTIIKWEKCYYDDFDSIVCDTKGNVLTSYKFDSKWEVYSTFFEYDSLSNRISIKSFDSKGKVLNYTRSSYKFDPKGQIVEETDTSIVDGIVNHPMVIKGKTIFDEDGNKTEDHLIDAQGALTSKYTYKYNENNQVVEENHLSGKGKIWSRIVYGYDNQGNINSWEQYDGNGNLTLRIHKKYDQKHNMTELTEYEGKDGQMKFRFRTQLKYDENNNQTEVNYFNENGELLSKELYSYTYDSHGNWIECVGSSPKFMGRRIVRKIAYF